jgi:SAM-dependent methyltransferase
VLNVGAGAGSYEPPDRRVVAVEPSEVMLAQRPPSAAPAVRARAEALPFPDQVFDVVMAILTLHHGSDRAGGLAECARVARQRVVLLTWDPAADAFWLLQEYLPAFVEVDRRQFPPMAAYAEAFGPAARVEVATVPVPRDCVDGFWAYWARPAAYLDPAVRAAFPRSRIRGGAGLEQLRADLARAWHARHGHLLAADALDLGYRLVVAHLPDRAA